MPEITTVDRGRYANLACGAFLGLGGQPDVDAAFDDAVAAAHDEYGHAGAVTTISAGDPARLTVVTTTPVSVELATVQALRALGSGGLEPGVVYALATTREASYRRRRVTVRVDDPTVDLGVSAPGGKVGRLTDELAGYVAKRLADAGAALADTEVIESVEVRSLRQRYKPVVVKNTGKAEARWVARVRATGTELGHGRTEGEARRAAVTAIKAGTVDGLETYTVDLEKHVRLAGWQPKTSITRTLVTQRATLRVTVAAVKNPERLRHTGWLFYGVAATPTPNSTTSAAGGDPAPVSEVSGDAAA